MIHKFHLNGYYIVLDVNSGGVHVVDELAYNMLDHITDPLERECPQGILDLFVPQYSAQQVLETYGELYELYEGGILFSGDDYEQFADRMVASPIKAMCLHVAHDCNLRCKYCFASTGDFGEGRRLLDFETGKKAIDFLIEKSKGRHNLELDFFGGEPLMNFEVVRQIVEYARSLEQEHNKLFRFTITTNGMLLDDAKIDYINKEMSNVVLSIDGRRGVNDKMRPCINGAGSYDIIMDKYKRLVEKRGHDQYYARGTFTKYNLDFSNDVMHLYEEGFDQLSVEPVVSPSDKDYALTEAELPRIFEEYETLAKKIIAIKKQGKSINFFHFMLDLDQGPCAIKRLRGCGCGNEYVAVTPDGDIYPCHQFVGMKEWKMGNLHEGTFDFKLKDYFSQTTVYNKHDCKECWAKFYCSGGCSASNLLVNGDIKEPHRIGCELERKRLECAIALKAIDAGMAD